MKGKGKGSKEKESDCPLKFPDLNPVDSTAACPRYTSVLGRDEETSPVLIEEVDSLQTDLETLLTSVAKRMRQLEGEIDILVNWQDKGKDPKKGTPGKVQPEREMIVPSPSGKRGGKGGGVEDKPSKKFKDSTGKGVPPKSLTPKSVTPKKGKVQQSKVVETPSPPPPKPPELPSPEQAVSKPAELPKLPRNDTPNRFWSMVEPYCAEITTEDLKVLEDIMASHDDDAEYYKIPSLGKHYSQKWAKEDMLEEKKQGSKLNDKTRRGLDNSSGSGDNYNGDDDSSPFGPLTQRLVQALIEENIMTPLDDTAISEADAVEAATVSPRSLAKQLNIGNTSAIERRIKRELEENGILEPDEKADDDPDDEILMALRKKQQELKALSQHNLSVTKRLAKMAKEEMQRQDLRTKMATADAEVMDAYRRIQATRQKKKALTKKEKDLAAKALKERESLLRQLDSLSS